MNSLQTNWEDAENNRRVEMEVEYQLDKKGVEIKNVTPQRIYFRDPASHEVTGSVTVWTDKGRRQLVDQMKTAGWLEALRGQIAASAVHDVVHAEPKGAAAENVPRVQV